MTTRRSSGAAVICRRALGGLLGLCLAGSLPTGALCVDRAAGKDSGSERLQALRSRARVSFPTGPHTKRAEPAGSVTASSSSMLRPHSSSPEAQASGGVPGTQSETSIAVSGNRVVVGFNQFDPADPNRRSGVAYSTDGAGTFTDQGGLPTGGATRVLLGDPSLAVCGDGKFYYSSILLFKPPEPSPDDSALSVSVGTFTGVNLSWTDPIQVLRSTSDFLDKEWLTCDRATNTLYMTYTRFVNANVGATTQINIEIIKSVNGGVTWSGPLVLESSTTESIQISYSVVGPNGEVYTIWERGIDDIFALSTKLEFRRSFNGGVSFDPKVVVRTMTPSFFPAGVGFNREDTLEIGTLAVDTSTGASRGNLYAVWVEREAGGGVRRDVFAARSTNQGANWSAPVRVNDDPLGNDQVMPWISVNAAGIVETFWYDYRNWTGMHTVDVYAARSGNGGASFGPNFRITTVPTSWFVPLTLTPNFGDYIQCVSEGTGFYPAWADGRNNDIDVFVSHVPTATCGNGVPDPFEQCDDGNTLDGDSCSGACATTLCGNGILEGSEACDDGNIRSGDGCSQTCRAEVCGDGIVQGSNREECDDGNTANGDGCSSLCQIELDHTAWIADERSRLALQSMVTGQVIQIGDPGFHEMGDLAFDAAGKLFGATGYNPNVTIGYHGVLLDLATLGLPGRGNLIGGSGWQAIQAIDFHPSTNVLYGTVVDSTGASFLVTLNPASGAVLTTLGNLGLITARAMAFDAAGTLHVSGRALVTDTVDKLYSVNLTTAAKTLIGSVGFVLSGMDFAPDGSLYGVTLRGTGADSGLVLVNKTTGAGTLLFSSGRLNQQGIRFAPVIALDHDQDGIHDIRDCAPLDNSNPPPGSTSGLVFSDPGGVTFSWSPAASSLFHNAYRGTITGPLGSRPPATRFDQACLESGDAQGNGNLLSSDPLTPPLGTAFYYVTSGEGCGEGPLGPDPGHPIPNANPCPTPP